MKENAFDAINDMNITDIKISKNDHIKIVSR